MLKQLVVYAGIFAFAFLPSIGLAQGFDDLGELGRQMEDERTWELSPTEVSSVSGSRNKIVDSVGKFLDAGIGYGGWYTWTHIAFKDSDKRALAEDKIRYIDMHDLRLWTLIQRPKQQDKLYVRLKGLWQDREVAATYTGGREVYDATRLDMGYYNRVWNKVFNLDKFGVTLGRQQFLVGRGIAYTGIADGVKLNFLKKGWNVDLAGSKIIRSSNDIDASRPYPGKDWSRRYFGWLQVSKKYHPLHGFNVFALAQRDNNKEVAEQTYLEYDFDSEYYGIGLNGQLIKDMKYWGEYIKEEGHRYAHGTNTAANGNLNYREKIDADAFTLGLQYFMNQFYGKPTLVAEYGEASGDTDRANVTNTINGNSGDFGTDLTKRHTNDETFLGFGIYPTGIASGFKFANLKVLKLGVNVNPLEALNWFKDFQVSYNYYRFRFDDENGKISDGSTQKEVSDIGKEHDIIIGWKALTDVKINFQYGKFKPGETFVHPTNPSVANNRTDDKITWKLSTTIEF